MLISNMRWVWIPRLHRDIRRFSMKINTNCLKDESQTGAFLFDDIKNILKLKEGDKFLDMTFGAGGHSSALLERIPQIKVIALDRDPEAHKCSLKLKEKYPNQVTPLLGTFSDLPKLLKENNIGTQSIDGILFDLGCSSFQLDDPERGFSVNKDGPLDMRMDGYRLHDGLTAADVLKHAAVEDLCQIFNIYGEPKKLIKIAKAVVVARQLFAPLKTVNDLLNIIESVFERAQKEGKKTHKAKLTNKVFQALRIFVNNELNELNYGIELAQSYLKHKGRAVVLSFNKLEDTIVKKHFNNQEVDNCTKQLPLMFFSSGKSYTEEEMTLVKEKLWKEIAKKVVFSHQDDISNPRKMSAMLRAAIKISDESQFN